MSLSSYRTSHKWSALQNHCVRFKTKDGKFHYETSVAFGGILKACDFIVLQPKFLHLAACA